MEAALGFSNAVSASNAAATVVVLIICFALPSAATWLRKAWHRLSVRTKVYLQTTANPKGATAKDPAPAVSKTLDFPDNWWTSKDLFELEKRAIFSKTWLHICHTSLLPLPGDFRTFHFADFSFLVIRGKDGIIRVFHNVCRHRAYNVTDKSSGRANILMCRYHGWTYDSRGKLLKAPKFDDVADFDKRQNGLFEIRTFIDSSGFLYANFDVYGSDGLTIRVGVPIRARLRLIDSWTVKADMNWKIAVAPGAFAVHSLVSLSRTANLLSRVSTVLESWTWPTEIELSSLTRVLRSVTGDLWLTISIVPETQSTTKIHCAFYTSRPDGLKTFPVDVVKREVSESTRRLESVFYEARSSGDIPESPNQEPLLAEIKAHSRLERLMRQEVHPASRLRETSQACRVADELCKELEAAERDGGTAAGLAW